MSAWSVGLVGKQLRTEEQFEVMLPRRGGRPTISLRQVHAERQYPEEAWDEASGRSLWVVWRDRIKAWRGL
jgi:hypothetical protein